MRKMLHLVILLSTALMTACAGTQIYKQEGVELKEYSELFFVPPTNDPRNVAPKVIAEMEKLDLNIHIVDPEGPMIGSQGTGFVISEEGHIITCAHVIGDSEQATVWLDGQRFESSVVAKDVDLDLAILKLDSPSELFFQPLVFRESSAAKMGEDVYTIGYPISNLLGNSARLSKGLISATKGLEDNPDHIQISAEIQPGNSGGPLFDEHGRVLGVVQQTLNPLVMLQQTGGSLPQNVNFGIKSDLVTDFITSHLSYKSPSPISDQPFDFEQIEKSVVRVKSGIISEEFEKAPKLIARIDYESFWDLWFRFRYFVVTFYDFDSQEMLFRAGQVGDNLASTESKSIEETFIKVKQTLKQKP